VVYELRQRAGLTQELLARLAGVDRSMISRYETGRRSPRLDTLQRLAEAVDFEVVVSFRPARRTDVVESTAPGPKPAMDGVGVGSTANASTGDLHDASSVFDVAIDHP